MTKLDMIQRVVAEEIFSRLVNDEDALREFIYASIRLQSVVEEIHDELVKRL